MNELIPFDFESQAVRVIMNEEAEPWFVAKDICSILGVTNPSQTVAPLDEDEKGICTTDTLSGVQELLTVSESGFYKIVFKSRKEEAKRFTKWVTSEVLPTLRRTGRYVFGAEIDESNNEQQEDMASLGRGMRIREHRRVFSEVLQLVKMANQLHTSQLEIVNNISQRLTGIDTVAMLSESGWSPPCLPAPAQTETEQWADIISEWLEQPEQRDLQYVTTKEILVGALDYMEDNMTVAATTQVGFIMKRMGWGKKRIRQQHKLGYVYVRPQFTTTH